MKAIYLYAAGGVAITFALAACVSNAASPEPQTIATEPTVAAAQPAPAPSPTPTPRPVVEEPFFENYLDAPQTPGTWTYADDPGETLALFGVGEQYRLILRCDKSTREIGMARLAENAFEGPRAVEIQTETTRRALTGVPVTSTNRLIVVDLDPRDPLLDAMAITKGRFAVGVEGERTLYLPAWAEVTRVIEDCR